MTLFTSRTGTALPFLANGRWARVAGTNVLLLLLTACGGISKPDQPGSEAQAVAEQPLTPQAPESTAPALAQPETGEVPAPGAPAAAPHATAEPPAPVPQPEPAAVPAPSAPVPAPQTTVKPAAPAPIAPAPSAPPPITMKPATPPPPKSAPPAPPSTVGKPREAGGKTAPSAAKTPAPAASLDLKELKQELRDTKAIGFFSKITLKNQMDDLLDRFRKYHQGQGHPPLTDLRRSYELLVMKVLSLVQDDDKKLASDIVASREAIWTLLADPKKFATLDVS
jgi:hypothetical protein